MDEDVPQRAMLGELTAQKTSKPTTKTRRKAKPGSCTSSDYFVFFVSSWRELQLQ
jgi:hypothetical protein